MACRGTYVRTLAARDDDNGRPRRLRLRPCTPPHRPSGPDRGTKTETAAAADERRTADAPRGERRRNAAAATAELTVTDACVRYHYVTLSSRRSTAAPSPPVTTTYDGGRRRPRGRVLSRKRRSPAAARSVSRRRRRRRVVLRATVLCASRAAAAAVDAETEHLSTADVFARPKIERARPPPRPTEAVYRRRRVCFYSRRTLFTIFPPPARPRVSARRPLRDYLAPKFAPPLFPYDRRAELAHGFLFRPEVRPSRKLSNE